MRIAHLSVNITDDPIKPGETFRTWCGIDHTARVGTEGSGDVPLCPRCHTKFQENARDRSSLSMDLIHDLSEELAKWDSQKSLDIMAQYVLDGIKVNSRYGILFDGKTVDEVFSEDQS